MSGIIEALASSGTTSQALSYVRRCLRPFQVTPPPPPPFAHASLHGTFAILGCPRLLLIPHPWARALLQAAPHEPDWRRGTQGGTFWGNGRRRQHRCVEPGEPLRLGRQDVRAGLLMLSGCSPLPLSAASPASLCLPTSLLRGRLQAPRPPTPSGCMSAGSVGCDEGSEEPHGVAAAVDGGSHCLGPAGGQARHRGAV